MTREEILHGLENIAAGEGLYDDRKPLKRALILGEAIKLIEQEQQWIPCSKRLPEEKTNPITQDFYEYQCTFKNKDVYDVRTYKFGKSHWWHGLSIMDNYVIAWRESPEPYKTKDGEEK